MNFNNEQQFAQLSAEQIAMLLSTISDEKKIQIETLQKKQENENKKEQVDEKEVMECLYNSSPIFSDYDNDLLGYNETKKAKMIYGQVQSGKSTVIAGIAVYNALVEKKSTLIIVRRCDMDYIQLRQKFDEGGIFGHFKLNVISCKVVDTLKLALSTPTIIIALADQSQINKFNQAYTELATPNEFDLLFDEGDDLAYHTNRNSAKYKMELEVIRPRARQTYLISATILTMLFKDFELTSDAIYDLRAPDNYKGINDIGFYKCDFDLREINHYEGLRFYETLSNQEVFKSQIDNGNGPALNHPIICLHKTTQHKYQNGALDAIVNHSELKKTWCVMTYNGKGVQLYHEELLEMKEIEIEMKVGRDTVKVIGEQNYKGVWLFKKIRIQSVLQYLKEFDSDCMIFTHIVIFAGPYADRSQNFSSNDFQWHLTHQVLHTTDRNDLANIVQASRLCGCFNDDIPLKLYTSQSTLNDMTMALQLQNRLIQGCRDIEGILPETYKQVPILSDNIPKTKLCKKSNPILNIQIRSDNFELMDTRQSDREWGIERVLENLKNGGTKVCEIIRLLWNSETKTFSTMDKDMIIQQCGLTNWTNYTIWNKNGGKFHIVSKSGNGWSINPELANVIQNYL